MRAREAAVQVGRDHALARRKKEILHTTLSFFGFSLTKTRALDVHMAAVQLATHLGPVDALDFGCAGAPLVLCI